MRPRGCWRYRMSVCEEYSITGKAHTQQREETRAKLHTMHVYTRTRAQHTAEHANTARFFPSRINARAYGTRRKKRHLNLQCYNAVELRPPHLLSLWPAASAELRYRQRTTFAGTAARLSTTARSCPHRNNDSSSYLRAENKNRSCLSYVVL